MDIHTLYASMDAGLEYIPANANVKLLIRHSFRPSLKYEDDPDNVSLTPRGEYEAYHLGTAIPMEIGFCTSSPILRCVQTVRELTKAQSKPFRTSEELGYSFIESKEEAQITLSQIGLKEIVFQMGTSKVKGFVDAIEGARNLLDFMFSSGGCKGQLDVFCTHDMHIALLDLLFFNSYKTSHELKNNWPGMLEGMWLWGERNDFHICWRNKLKHCIDYLLFE